MSGVTIFVLIGANKFITVKVFLRLFTISTRFKDVTFFSHPNSGHFLDWFFNWTIDVGNITVFVLIRTNEFITVEVFLRLFTISARFQNLAFFSHPNSSHFLDRFFNRTIDVCCITIFVLVGTNEFVAVKVFFWLFTIRTRFKNFTSLSHPNSSHFLDWFFYWFVDVSSNGTVNLSFHKFITRESILWFEVWCYNWSLQCLTRHRDPASCFEFCHRTFLNGEWRDLCRSNLWCLRFHRRCCRRVSRVLRLWAIRHLRFFRFFTCFWRWFFRFFTGFWCRRCWRCLWWRIRRYRRSNRRFLRCDRFSWFNWFIWNRIRHLIWFHWFGRFNRGCGYNRRWYDQLSCQLLPIPFIPVDISVRCICLGYKLERRISSRNLEGSHTIPL